jgi:hypothetical protein
MQIGNWGGDEEQGGPTWEVRQGVMGDRNHGFTHSGVACPSPTVTFAVTLEVKRLDGLDQTLPLSIVVLKLLVIPASGSTRVTIIGQGFADRLETHIKAIFLMTSSMCRLCRKDSRLSEAVIKGQTGSFVLGKKTPGVPLASCRQGRHSVLPKRGKSTRNPHQWSEIGLLGGASSIPYYSGQHPPLSNAAANDR